MLGNFPSSDPFSRVSKPLYSNFLFLITWLYRFAITNDFFIFLNLNIIRIFMILKKIYSDNARGFLLVDPHLLQYIGEDKKVLPFSPLFLEFIGEKKEYFFLAPTLVLKVGILVICLLCSHRFAAKRN
jgi:hypothetical protein